MARRNKKHHKVPRTYLEAFTNDDGRVWVADKELRLFIKKPKEILTENDFYTVRFPNGGATLKIETEFLGGIETAYAELYRNRISQRIPLNHKEKATMALFVASMLERSPRRREALQDGFNQVRDVAEKMQQIVDSMSAEERTNFNRAQPSISARERERSIPMDEIVRRSEDTASYHSSVIPGTVTFMAPIIYDMGWGFMVRPEDSEPFITSDSPCTLDDPSLEVNSFYSPGLANKDVEICLPLSPDVSLLCGWKLKRDGHYMRVDKEHIVEINRRVLRRSETIVGNDKAFLERQIERIRQYQGDKKSS